MSPEQNPTTWLNQVWDSDLTSTQKLVAAYLRRHMNDDSKCAWPAVATIAKRCSLGVRTVQGALKALCEQGFLIQDGTSQHQTVVYVIGHRGGAAPAGAQQTAKGGAAPAPKETSKETNTTKGAKRFVPPTLMEATAYIQQNNYRVNPETWFAHYESNGWKVGRNTMKDWKASIRYWHTQENNKPLRSVQPQSNQSTRHRPLAEDLNDTSWAN